MTGLWVLSDLHLEHVPHPDQFRPEPGAFDVLVCAGDVWQGRVDLGLRTLRRLAGSCPVVFVLGNHEHWNACVPDTLEEAGFLAPRYEVTLLTGAWVEVEQVWFIGETLWTDGQLGGGCVLAATTGEQIDVPHQGGSHLITFADAARLHRAARGRLERGLAKPPGAGPRVVVTHHAPHPLCLPEADRGRWGAGLSASDLSPLTDAGLAELWVHGHVHASVDMVRPGGTRVLCNPAGRGFENTAFQDGLVVEIGPA